MSNKPHPCKACNPHTDSEHPDHKRDRIALIPDKFQYLACGFRYSAERRGFVPVTKKLAAFTAGDGDTHEKPWAPAGYSNPMDTGDSLGNISNCYRGGAWSVSYSTQLLSLTIDSPSLRLVAASKVTGTPETPTFPRGGGELPRVRGDVHNTPDLRTSMLADFWAVMMHASQAKLMPPGANTSCSAVCGPLRAMNTGFTIGGQCIVDANSDDRPSFSPNKFDLTFSDGLDFIPLREGVTPPADGDFAVVDFKFAASFAYVRDTLEGVDEIDREKIAAWKRALANPGFASPSLPSDGTESRLLHAAETFQRRLAAMERGELPTSTLAEVGSLQRSIADVLASAAR